jgi:hypothetical protein
MATTTSSLTTWQRAWRDGFVPQLTTRGLQGLCTALQENSPRLITGATTQPPPLQCTATWPVEGCCPVSFALLDGCKPYHVSVGALEERWAMACYQADQLLGEPAACRYFLNQVDEWSRVDLLRNLLPEVELALAEREPAVAAA